MGDCFLKEITENGKVYTKPLTNEWITKAEGDFITVLKSHHHTDIL